MAKAPTDIRSLARSYTELAIQTLAAIAQKGQNEGARVSASQALLDRGWGKPTQPIAGDDTADAIRMIVTGVPRANDD